MKEDTWVHFVVALLIIWAIIASTKTVVNAIIKRPVIVVQHTTFYNRSGSQWGTWHLVDSYTSTATDSEEVILAREGIIREWQELITTHGSHLNTTDSLTQGR
jgi:hypothetical protein